MIRHNLKEKRLEIVICSMILILLFGSVLVHFYLKKNYAERYRINEEFVHMQDVEEVYYDEESGFQYAIIQDESENSGIMTCAYKGEEISVSVPEVIQDMPVIWIGETTFLYLDNVQEIKLSENIKKICNFSFGSCRNLKKIHIPSSVKEIEENAIAYGDETMKDVIIIAEKGSNAEKYAKEKGMKVETE